MCHNLRLDEPCIVTGCNFLYTRILGSQCEGTEDVEVIFSRVRINRVWLPVPLVVS